MTGRGSPGSGSSEPEIDDPPPNGITTASWVDRRLQDGLDLLLADRAHDDVREPRQVPPSLPDQVAQRLAATVHHPVKRVRRDSVRSQHASPTRLRSGAVNCVSGTRSDPKLGGGAVTRRTSSPSFP